MMDSTITRNDRTRSGVSQRITEILSIYVLPLFICLLSLAALLQLPAHYPSAAGFSLSLQTLPAPVTPSAPSINTQTALAQQPTESRLSTHDPLVEVFTTRRLQQQRIRHTLCHEPPA